MNVQGLGSEELSPFACNKVTICQFCNFSKQNMKIGVIELYFLEKSLLFRQKIVTLQRV